MNRENTIRLIEENKVIVILRGFSYDELFQTVSAMREGGIVCCEVTYDSLGKTPDSQIAEHIARLCKDFPDMVIGAGTVLTEAQVELTKNAGGKFVISPDTNPEIIKKTRELGLVSIPGALTPSEATLANRSGADFVKLFPNGEVKPTYLKALVAPLSHIKFLAVGGVSAANAQETLAMGAVGIGVATAIANKELIKKGDYAGVTRLARDFVNAVKG